MRASIEPGRVEVDMAAVVDLKDVWVHYHDKAVLEGVSLNVDEHDFLGIIGPNGGGKTTLLKVILGLIKPSRGEVNVFGGSPEKNRRLMGYVPQISHFDAGFPITVWDVVAIGRLGHRRPPKRYTLKDKRMIEKALEQVDMIGLKDHAIGKLSGGERQRVFIARALASEPKLLLLDEPTASVDKRLDTKFWESLNVLKRRISIILVTHDISALSIYVDKIACLNRKLYYQGGREITPEIWAETYQCPVDMIAHGLPHRILKEH